MKNSLEGLKGRFELEKERLSKLEDKAIETKEQKEKGMCTVNRASRSCVTISEWQRNFF